MLPYLGSQTSGLPSCPLPGLNSLGARRWNQKGWGRPYPPGLNWFIGEINVLENCGTPIPSPHFCWQVSGKLLWSTSAVEVFMTDRRWTLHLFHAIYTVSRHLHPYLFGVEEGLHDTLQDLWTPVVKFGKVDCYCGRPSWADLPLAPYWISSGQIADVT